jgi:hypothetical protein
MGGGLPLNDTDSRDEARALWCVPAHGGNIRKKFVRIRHLIKRTSIEAKEFFHFFLTFFFYNFCGPILTRSKSVEKVTARLKGNLASKF